ncbi:MAG: hypothetical protein P8X96_14435 [Desulfobacteraceae bacterium]
MALVVWVEQLENESNDLTPADEFDPNLFLYKLILIIAIVDQTGVCPSCGTQPIDLRVLFEAGAVFVTYCHTGAYDTTTVFFPFPSGDKSKSAGNSCR